MANRAGRSADPVVSFKKILELERDRGYSNTAVYGGLDRYLERWGSTVAHALGQPSLSPRLTHARYAEKGVEERRTLVARWIADLEGAPEEGAAEKGHPIPSGRPQPKAKAPPPGRTLDSPVTELWGVSKVTAGRLRRLGVHTVRELLYLLPRRHNDFSRTTKVAELKVGLEQTVVVTVWESRERVWGRRKAAEAIVGDETGNVRAVWFGRPYLARTLRTNAQVVLSGRVSHFRGQRVFESPEYEVLEKQENLVHTGRLVPAYPLTEGLTPRTLRRLVWRALDGWIPLVQEFLPEGVVQRMGLMPLGEALLQAHFPDDLSTWEAARRRLAFDELFLLQMAVLMRRHRWQREETGPSLKAGVPVLGPFIKALPFSLTAAQRRTLAEIVSDLERGTPPMSRLLQGEVGSGKTVVALAALLIAAAAGYQGAMMAPTELLAEQHFSTVARLLQPFARPVERDGLLLAYIDPLPKPLAIGLLLGRMSGKEKEEMRWRAQEGAVDIVIGTHALIQETVGVPRLSLAVVDEQHRFGVLQRAALRERGEARPHVLVMSATPIPRTLAFTLYGDLDISVLDELPPGRQRITTRWVPPGKRAAAYGFLRKQAQRGRQAFVVCPLIEESEVVEAKAATEEYQRLSKEVFPDLRLGLIHGRMPSSEKEDTMRRFRDGELDILVSTPVVEVGIDVPNATVMLIEAADRFGLAQLHQFRGRVGRGEHASYCLLLADSPSPEARERLRIIENTLDGYELAEADLRMRGPGDFFGTRQSGLPALKVARLSDRDLLLQARQQAEKLLQEDPSLESLQHRPLSQEVEHLLSQVTGETG